MRFNEAQWQTPLPTVDEGLFRVLESHAMILKADRPKPDDLVARAQAEILRSLKDAVPGLDVDDLADRLGVSVRTFQRRLADEDVSTTQLVDALRETQARELVASGSSSLSEIAFFLGFAEQSAFSRVFKRWTGQAPRGFKQSRDLPRR